MPSKSVREADSEVPAIVVVAVVANMKTFRVPFYRLLAAELGKRNISLRVVFSDPHPSERDKHDTTDLQPPIGVKVRAFHPLGARALVQMLPTRLLARADLIIVVQANGYLLNYVLQLLSNLHLKRVAFWGHAFNHQGNPGSFREKIKKFFATKVVWWFTYTEQTSAYLTGLGFPAERISVIENAIDTGAFARDVAECRASGIDALRRSVSGCDDAFIAVCCGSLYPEKQLRFLLDVGDLLSARHKNFRLLTIGDGPDRDYVRAVASSRPWLKYYGPQFGDEKVRLFAASDVFLNPGLVGLAILDSFAAGLPFITSDYTGHSPEVAYLEHLKNGLVLPFEVSAFAQGVEETISNRPLLATLRSGATASARRFTLENMVSKVADGIYRCLQADVRMSAFRVKSR